MRTLVTGGAGFIGGHLVSALAQAGAEVVVVDHAEPSPSARTRNIRYVATDLMNRAVLLPALAGVDVVYHLAWAGIPSSSNEDPGAHVCLNLAPTLALFDACLKASVKRVVFFSSGGAVYGRALELPIPEEHTTLPLSIYGGAKLAAEEFLGLYGRQYGLDHVILRPSVPYGEGQNPSRGQGAVSVFLKSAITGEPITLWGGCNIVRDFFYVGDLAKAGVAAADAKVKRGVYNIGGGEAITLGQLLELIQKVTGATVNVRIEPPRNVDPPAILLDIDKARRILGWKPEVKIADGLARTREWLRSMDVAQLHPPAPSIFADDRAAGFGAGPTHRVEDQSQMRTGCNGVRRSPRTLEVLPHESHN